MLIFYEVVTNTDLTEGKGQEVGIGLYQDCLDAFKNAKGKGVFGTDAKVVKVEQYTTLDEVIKAGKLNARVETVYDNNGWKPGRNPLEADPEYAEYLRLKEKFT